MPKDYIVYREDHENNGAADWNTLYNLLSPIEKQEFHNLVFKNQLNTGINTKYPKVNKLVSHYK